MRKQVWGQKVQEKKDQTAVAAARGSGGGRRTCLHLFQRARWWVVTSRVGRHGNLLGLPKRGSIVLPVKTARDPDPTGSPTHMDSRSYRMVVVVMVVQGERGRIRRPSSGNHRFLLFEVVRSSDVKSAD